MSRHNKVNKDHYVQRGRLTPDEAARELAKMRQVGSQHTWQPTKKNEMPRLESKDRADGTETTEDKGDDEEATSQSEARPVRKSKAKSAKTSAGSGNGKKTTGKAKSGKTKNSAAKSTAAKPKRKAVLARNVGGGGATPQPAAKRRKS